MQGSFFSNLFAYNSYFVRAVGTENDIKKANEPLPRLYIVGRLPYGFLYAF